ncbi:MAG: SDR family oxidoreductase [Deltaproteobacteria bacterium]|nr:SDR family oxidoreductase [Deltaproteobacteria bacterium]
MTIHLTDKTALVTGATGQLGEAMVLALAQCGANVIIHCKQNRAKAQALQDAVTHMERSAFIVQGDIGLQTDVLTMKQEIESNFTLPDIVVTNAVSQIFPWQSVLDEEIEDYENQFKSCVMQNVLMAKAFVPHMITNRWGRFIGINTETSVQAFETQSAYVSGKRGMDGVLRVLAREVGPHCVTVNQIAPGWIKTKSTKPAILEAQQKYAETVPMRRLGDAKDIANAVAFLASDLAAFITGAFIPVNGGNVFVGI